MRPLDEGLSNRKGSTMLESKRAKMESAARNANDKFARAEAREAEFRNDRQKRLDADAVKTAKLRALRMAKETADREVQEREAAEKRAAVEAKRATQALRKSAKQ